MAHAVEVSLLIENELAREGLRRILVAEGFGVRERAGSFPSRVEPNSGLTHTVIMDRVSGLDLPAACERIGRTEPHAKLVILAERCALDEVEEAFHCGIDG